MAMESERDLIICRIKIKNREHDGACKFFESLFNSQHGIRIKNDLGIDSSVIDYHAESTTIFRDQECGTRVLGLTRPDYTLLK